jgi:erythromycin esterase
MRKIIIPFIFLLFLSCNKKITSALSNKMIVLETRNELPSDFKKLDRFIENKEIILLGACRCAGRVGAGYIFYRRVASVA